MLLLAWQHYDVVGRERFSITRHLDLARARQHDHGLLLGMAVRLRAPSWREEASHRSKWGVLIVTGSKRKALARHAKLGSGIGGADVEPTRHGHLLV
jgi:hypothetical protein